LDTGGLERQLYYLLRSIDRELYRPAVAVWHYCPSDVHVGPIQNLGVAMYAIENTASRVTKLRAFRRLARALEPEVIHSYSFHTNPAAHWAAYGTRAVAVGSIRSDFNWAKAGSGPVLGRLSARWPSYQISNSVLAATDARNARSFFRPAHCEVVRNGVDLERFRQSDIPAGPVRIAAVGYFLPVKRWERLLRAARVLKRRGLQFEVEMIGGGPLKQALQEQAHHLDIDDCVRFFDHRQDVEAVLARASLMVLTSDTEGCPNAVMEAMACGRPVVAAGVGDIPDLVEDGVSGFIVGLSDESALVDRLAGLIADRDLCRRMGQAGRRKAEREFGMTRLARETLGAYRNAGWNQRARQDSPTEAFVGD